MTSDFLFSFESSNSLKFAIGPASFSVNTEYIAKMKFLFNKASIYPVSEDKKIVSDALDMVALLIDNNTFSEYRGQCEEMVYFVKNFLDPCSDYYSIENLQYLYSALDSLLRDVELWLNQNKEKNEKKKAEIEAELELMDIEEENLKKRIREYLECKNNCMNPEDNRYFADVGKKFKHTYNSWVYRIALDDEIATFYFLHNMRTSHLKSKLIIQCVENKNFGRAMELIDLVIKTSGYPDYAPKYGNKWELTALNVIRDILYEYLPSNSEYKSEYTEEKRLFVVEIAERLMPYLADDSQKDILGYLSLVEPNHRYEQRYISTLLDDVEHYAQIKRPRGWGGARVVNRISEEIILCFSFLEGLGEIDVIVSVLSKLKAAGPTLMPINYYRWLNEFCRRKVRTETFDYIKSRLS